MATVARWRTWTVVVAAIVLAQLLCIAVGLDIRQLVVGPIVFVTLTCIIGAALSKLMTAVSRDRQQ
jgi:hypothetical protein